MSYGNSEGYVRVIVEMAPFVFALLQGAAAYFWILDRHRAMQKAQAEGSLIPSRRFPLLPTFLALGSALAIILGFWMVFHPPSQSNSHTEVTLPPVAKQPLAKAKTEVMPSPVHAPSLPRKRKQSGSFAPLATQSGFGNNQSVFAPGATVQQSTSGPNSPNIAGSGNQVTYSDTSQLPVLSQNKIDAFKNALIGTNYKIIFRYSLPDRDAGVLANDLLGAAKASGWSSDFQASVGGFELLVPVAVSVKSDAVANMPQVAVALQAVREAVGMKVPGFIDPSIEDNEIDVLLSSHPVKRPK